MRHGATALLLAIAAVAADPAPAAGQIIYSAPDDFSPNNNPIGVWSYGYSPSLAGPYILYTEHGVGTYPNPNGTPTGLDYWAQNIGLHNPAVVHNSTSNTVLIGGTATYQPGQLGFHPGPGGQVSIIRFT